MKDYIKQEFEIVLGLRSLRSRFIFELLCLNLEIYPLDIKQYLLQMAQKRIDVNIPNQFKCPISGSVMKDPVLIVETGTTCERKLLEQIFGRGIFMDPKTGHRLKNKTLVPNWALKSLIQKQYWMYEKEAKEHRQMIEQIHKVLNQKSGSINLKQTHLEINSNKSEIVPQPNFSWQHKQTTVLKKKQQKEDNNCKLVKNPKKTRLIMMVDATISMSDLFVQLKIFLPQIFDDTYQTLKNEKFPGCLEIQIVLYRNYNSDFDKILEISTFDNQGEVLKNFISKSQVSGGWGNEAIEVALQYVNTLQNVNEIFLIGDAGGNTPQEVKVKRAKYRQLQNKRIQKGMTPTTTEDQVNKLVQKKVKVSGFYLRNKAPIEQYFEGICRQTNGEAKPINIYDKNASQVMTQFIVEHALKIIGSQEGKGDELVAAYAQIRKKRVWGQ